MADTAKELLDAIRYGRRLRDGSLPYCPHGILGGMPACHSCAAASFNEEQLQREERERWDKENRACPCCGRVPACEHDCR